MPVLVPGEVLRSRGPTLLVENDLAAGSWLFRLTVVDDAGLESTPPAELVVRVVARTVLGPLVDIGPVVGPAPVIGPGRVVGPGPVVGPTIRTVRPRSPRTRATKPAPEPVRSPRPDAPKRPARRPRRRKKP